MLKIDDLHVSYGGIRALRGISLEVPDGKIVTLIGANGAGKSTTLRTISGLVKADSGSVTYDGQELLGKPINKVLEAGIAQSPEGRRVFPNLTVLENLKIGAYLRKDKDGIEKDIRWVYDLFPRLQERHWQQAGTLSGNPVAMAAGLAQLRELLKGNAYERLEQLGARMEEGIREALKKHGRNYTFHRAGSMFCLFFTEEEVYNLESAQKAPKKLFKSFFWNMLEQGVYFAPSPYETGFISTAHTEEDIDRTVEAVRISLSRLG